MRIILVTDSHLAPGIDAFDRNWRAIREYVASAGADLTIHLGDITVDGRDDPAQFHHMLALSGDWPTPMRYLPGNHDIGDNPPGPGIAAKEPLRLERLADYRTAFGPDAWASDAEGWHLLGVNAQLFGSETVEEANQWSWLEAQLDDVQGRPVVLLLHKPLFQSSPSDAAPHHRYVPAEPRRRLFDLLARMDVRAVISGHTHQYLDRVVEGIRHLWVPSTAFYLPDTLQERIGEKITGLGVLDLAPGALRVHVVCPEGVARHNILDHPVYPGIREARERLLPRSKRHAGVRLP